MPALVAAVTEDDFLFLMASFAVFADHGVDVAGDFYGSVIRLQYFEKGERGEWSGEMTCSRKDHSDAILNPKLSSCIYPDIKSSW